MGGVKFGSGPAVHALPRLSAGDDERVRPPSAGSVAEQPRVHPAADRDILAKEFARGLEMGKEQGREEGRREIQDRMEEAEKRFDGVGVALQDQLKRLSDRLERDAFHFALAVAGKIVKREVSLDDQVIVRQVQEAIRRVVGVESIKLRVNPADEAMARRHRSAFLASADSVREIVIETDEKIEQGGCILESSSGNVDARRSTQLKQIEAALFPTAKEIE